MKIRNIYPQYLLIPALALLLFACDERHPGIEYAPQMYHSIPMEPFTQVEGYEAPFKDGRNQQVPPVGTIAFGTAGSYEYADIPNYPEPEDLKLIQAMQNPIPASAEAIAEGKILYDRFCLVCHGKTGKGDGTVPKGRSEIAPKPYDSPTVKDKSNGEIYHTIMVGLNMMGSYSSQIEYMDRWKVVHYVSTLQGNDPLAVTTAGGEEDMIEEEGAAEEEAGAEEEGHEGEDHEEEGHSHSGDDHSHD